VNATGITTWSDAGSNGLTATQAAFPRQDADNRRGGFLFTKLDKATGATLADSAATWGCVRDGVTGLTWEVKTSDGGVHDQAWTYTWYNSNAATNCGNAGTPAGGSCGIAIPGCDTEKFVNAVNSIGWCGFSNWRMPTVDELKSIVNYSTSNPSITTAWFTNTKSSYFWSGSPYAGYSGSAWRVDFGNGLGYSGDKSDSYYVRLVRGGQ
jgi:hypothetical protein